MGDINKAKEEIRAAMLAHKESGGTFVRDTWGVAVENDKLVALGPVCAIGAWALRQEGITPRSNCDIDDFCRDLAADRLGLEVSEVNDLVYGFDFHAATYAPPHVNAYDVGAELAYEFVGPLPADDDDDEEDGVPVEIAVETDSTTGEA